MNLSQFAALLDSATEISQAETLLGTYLSQFSIYSYAFTHYRGHVKTGQKLQYHCVSKALEEWHLHYLEQQYADADRTLQAYYHTTLPCYWDTQSQLKQSKNKREKRIREESIKFGIDKGVSIPIHGPHHDFSSLTLHQRKNEHCLDSGETQQFEWIAAGQLFYCHIKRILQQTSKLVRPAALTKREAQCLSYTAKSYRVEQIAKTLKISERTVNFHLQNANRKLGTHNKYQAAYRFIELDS